MIPPSDDTAALTHEPRAELMRSMKAAIAEFFAAPPDTEPCEELQEDAP